MDDRITTGLRIVTTAFLVAAVVLVAVLSAPALVGAEDSFVVLSGSMEPTLRPGDVVVVGAATPTKIDEGDIITFHRTGTVGGDGRDRITHRVVEKRRTDDGVVYRTKGDANGDADRTLVEHEQVVGEVRFHVPLVGRLFVAIDGTPLEALLAVVPGLLLVGSGVRTLFTAATVEE